MIENTGSRIGSSMIVTGEVECQGPLVIDGCLQGSLKGNTLVISETGQLEGKIIAESIECSGKITGNVITQSLYLKKSGNQFGTVETCELRVEQGAVLDCALQSGAGQRLQAGSGK